MGAFLHYSHAKTSMTVYGVIVRLLATIGVLALYSMFVIMTRPFPWHSGFMPEQVIQQEQFGWIAFSVLCVCGGLGSILLIWRKW